MSSSHHSVGVLVVYDNPMRKHAARHPIFRFDGSSIIFVPAGGRPRAGRVSVRYRDATGEFVDTTLDRLSVADVADGRPVREFRSYKGRRHYSGWYWSSTVTRMVAYESRLELARILLADFDPTIAALSAQPFQLIGNDGGRRRRYVPDLMLHGADGSVTVVEVKPQGRLADPKVIAVVAWARCIVGERGWAFEVWSGTEAVVLANIRYLAGYRRPLVVDSAAVGRAIACVDEESTIASLEHAMARDCPVSVARPAILHLLWCGGLSADLTQPLQANTRVWPRRRGSS
jgi:hypothetical protein